MTTWLISHAREHPKFLTPSDRANETSSKRRVRLRGLRAQGQTRASRKGAAALGSASSASLPSGSRRSTSSASAEALAPPFHRGSSRPLAERRRGRLPRRARRAPGRGSGRRAPSPRRPARQRLQQAEQRLLAEISARPAWQQRLMIEHLCVNGMSFDNDLCLGSAHRDATKIIYALKQYYCF